MSSGVTALPQRLLLALSRSARSLCATEESISVHVHFFYNPPTNQTSLVSINSATQDLILAGGEKGYPLSPAHTDLRDIEITTSAEANLVGFSRQDVLVDLSRSVWWVKSSRWTVHKY